MGTGKTTKAIEHLKQYLASRHGQNIEVYVPRHDLADEWEQGLDGINARVVHVYPRTGGKWDENSRSYAHPIMCHRADYVRDLEANGHSIYGNACLNKALGEHVVSSAPAHIWINSGVAQMTLALRIQSVFIPMLPCFLPAMNMNDRSRLT